MGKGETWAERKYRNALAEANIPEAAVGGRIEETWRKLFYGADDERLFFPVGADLGYILDTGNDDVRTEGLSYGMMMAVQMGDRDVFDRLWLWAVTHHRQAQGPYRGYFAWSAAADGRRLAEGPAPDGEEYFALALFFASHRWGDRQAPFDYAAQARGLLGECLHKGEAGEGSPLWDPATRLIKFVPESPWTDPSYHLPHFYDLFGFWADEEDRPFWRRAAEASRDHIHAACHPLTGLAPEYAEFDGRPHRAAWDYGHHQFYSDSYRVAANIGLDCAWFSADPRHRDLADRIQKFFEGKDRDDLQRYDIDGTPAGEPALHPDGLLATVAMASLASSGGRAVAAVRRFWQLPLRRGKRRYYDNCLQFFALLALAGRYRIW